MTMTVPARLVLRAVVGGVLAGLLILASSPAWAGSSGPSGSKVWAARPGHGSVGSGETSRLHPDGMWFLLPGMPRPLAAGDVVIHRSERGQASWYARPGMCAASLALASGTVATVTDAETGRSVAVIIDDRGPYGVRGRIISLCKSAFARLAPLSRGVLTVRVGW